MIEDKELAKHIKALGLSTISEYQKWCKANGFSNGLNKNEAVRHKELQYLKDLAVKQAFEKGREKHKPLGKKIQSLLEVEEFSLSQIKDPKIKDFFDDKSLRKLEKHEYRSFLSFLQVVDKKSKLIKESSTRFIADFGHQTSNQLINALFLVFKNKEKWKNSVEEWDCNTKNLTRQFSSLIRHLFCKYKMPVFMDSAWFSENSQELNWWFFVAEGNNIRKAPNLPISLTKIQAHFLMDAPEHYTITKALRYGQIMGVHDDKRLVDAVLQTSLGRGFANDEFWWTVINMFIQNPMLDRQQLAPMVDYINFQKFSPQAPHPGFTMKGRNPQVLLDQVEEWHSKVSKEQGKGYMEWPSCKIPSYTKEEKIKEGMRVWTITELTNSKLLTEEGRSMSHCVGSYKYSAAKGLCSIWSLKCDGARVMTIEVINNTHNIVQVRGKFNKLPEGREKLIIQDWARENGLSISSTGF